MKVQESSSKYKVFLESTRFFLKVQGPSWRYKVLPESTGYGRDLVFAMAKKSGSGIFRERPDIRYGKNSGSRIFVRVLVFVMSKVSGSRISVRDLVFVMSKCRFQDFRLSPSL